MRSRISSRVSVAASAIDHYETVRRRKDGALRDISLTVSPIVGSRGTIVGASKIARDITAQRALARQKDEFLGIASHELRTPVTGIKGYAQLLERRFRKMGDVPATAMFAKLDGQINRLTGLIDDLLDATRIESGKLPFRPAPFDLNALIGEIVEEIAAHDGQAHHRPGTRRIRHPRRGPGPDRASPDEPADQRDQIFPAGGSRRGEDGA